MRAPPPGRPRRRRAGPSASAAIGGAMATGYHRCAGHTAPGASPVAAASTSASVGAARPPRRTGPACGPPRVSPSGRARPRAGARHPGLADVGAGADHQDHQRAGRPGHAARRADRRRAHRLGASGAEGGDQRRPTCGGRVGGGQRDPQPGRAPAARWGAGWPAPTGPASSSAADAVQRGLLLAEDDGHDRARVPGGDPFDVVGQARRAGARPRASAPGAARTGRRRRPPAWARW